MEILWRWESDTTFFNAGTTRGRAPIPMNMPRGQGRAGGRVRQTSNVMRHVLTFYA